jgi:hypothetical protein
MPMSKRNFIWRYGLPVTVTRLDNSTYQTRMLYHMASRPVGVFGANFFLSTEYMRDGIFRVDDDIAPGYIITVNSTNEKMFVTGHETQFKFEIPQSKFAHLVVLDFPIQVELRPSQADEAVARDKFGRPVSALPTTTIGVVITKADTDISPTISGGKPVECLEFYTMIDAIHENDEIVWNSHVYRVSTVWPFGLAGQTQMMFCKAQREIDM